LCEYKRFFDEVPVGLYRTSIEDGTFLIANKFCATMLGFGDVETLIKSVKAKDLYVPEKRQELLEAIRKNSSIQDFEIEITLSNKKIWVAVTAKLYEKEGYLEGSLMNITKRKTAEKELNDLKLKFIATMESVQKDVKSRLNP